MKKELSYITILAGIFGVLGCASTVPAPTSTTFTPYVNDIELSQTQGEVGKRFSADIEISATRLGLSDIKVENLPLGLRLDTHEGVIVGTPLQEGFFTVSVAVRKKQERGIHYNTVTGNWFTEQIELSIYKPLVDDEVMASIYPTSLVENEK